MTMLNRNLNIEWPMPKSVRTLAIMLYQTNLQND